MAKELYVGHISNNAYEEDIRKLFSVMGTVTSVHLIIDPETREFKRCGYVRMAADVDLKEVVETLDGAYLVDQEIHVSIARPQKPGMSKSGKPGKFGGPKKAGFGAKGPGGQKAGTAPKGNASAKAPASKSGTERTSGDGSKPKGGAKPAQGAKSGAGHRPGGEKKGPRRGK